MGEPAGAAPQWARDYFGPLYEFALRLIEKGLAYVCDLSPDDTDKYRGAPDRPGVDSPFRNRPMAEKKAADSRLKAPRIRRRRASTSLSEALVAAIRS